MKLLKFSRALLLAIVMLFAAKSASAQCPDPTWSQGHWDVKIAGTNCYATVWYCYKPTSTGVDFIIQAIQAYNSTDCNALTSLQIVTGAIDGFYNDPPVPVGVTVFPCGQGTTTVIKHNFTTCWHVSSAGLPVEWTRPDTFCPLCPVYMGCGEMYCSTTCNYCKNVTTGKLVKVGGCTTTSSGSNSCTAVPSSGQFELNTCYDIDHCNLE